MKSYLDASENEMKLKVCNEAQYEEVRRVADLSRCLVRWVTPNVVIVSGAVETFRKNWKRS